MAAFELVTFIDRSPEIVFDLCRNIDLHMVSTKETNEKAIAGKTSGLIGLNETVTWQARHLFKTRLFTSKITDFHYPFSFTDQMVKGDLKSFSHIHLFEKKDSGTLVKDIVTLEAPYGMIGKAVMFLFLKNYFKRLLIKRNSVLKQFAETGSA